MDDLSYIAKVAVKRRPGVCCNDARVPVLALTGTSLNNSLEFQVFVSKMRMVLIPI